MNQNAEAGRSRLATHGNFHNLMGKDPHERSDAEQMLLAAVCTLTTRPGFTHMTPEGVFDCLVDKAKEMFHLASEPEPPPSYQEDNASQAPSPMTSSSIPPYHDRPTEIMACAGETLYIIRRSVRRLLEHPGVLTMGEWTSIASLAQAATTLQSVGFNDKG